MSDTAGITQGMGNPYKIVDHTRERRKGITASSLKELTSIARSRLALPVDADLTIVLEQDGKKMYRVSAKQIYSDNSCPISIGYRKWNFLISIFNF